MWPLDDLAKLVGGQITGSPTLEIQGAASVCRAQPQQITLVTSAAYLDEFEAGPAVAAIVGPNVIPKSKACIQVDQPEIAFAKIVALFRPVLERSRDHISPQAVISPTAIIAENVCIHPGAVIMDYVEISCGATIFPNVTIMENCRIGAHVTIYPGAVLYEHTEVGDRTIIHANVVLGAYGFGYSTSNGEHKLSPQLGNVRIESDVEIGAGTTIDRGTYDSTVIGAGTKLDNLVMIGHNCQIGKHNLLCSQVGIAGSCETGDYVVMGGQVGSADHLKIGSHAQVGAKSGLMHDVPAGQRYFGIPARPAREEMQLQANRARLPEMRRTIRDLEKQLEQLQHQLHDAVVQSIPIDSTIRKAA